ncbi:hypothetical protein BGZ58_003853, partial [Dissophora ornata]
MFKVKGLTTITSTSTCNSRHTALSTHPCPRHAAAAATVLNCSSTGIGQYDFSSCTRSKSDEDRQIRPWQTIAYRPRVRPGMNSVPFESFKEHRGGPESHVQLQACARKQLNNKKRIIEEMQFPVTQELEESEGGKS